MKKSLFLALFTSVLIIGKLQAQVDSLYSALAYTQNDSLKNEIYKQLYDHYYDAEHDSTQVVANAHYAFAKEVSIPYMIVDALINLGLYQDVFIGNMDKSLQYYREAYDIAETHSLSQLKDIAHYIGVAFHVIDDYERAKKYYAEAYFLAQELGDEYRSIASGINLASIYSSLQSYDTAELFFKKILISSEKKPSYSALHDKARMNLANLFIRKQHYDSAYGLLETGYHYQINNQQYRDALQSLNYLLEAKVKDQHFSGMDTLISLNQSLIDSTQNARVVALSYGILTNAYAALGDYKNAFLTKNLHLNAYQAYKEAQREDLLYELETKYRNEKQQNEINALKVETQEAEIASQRRTNQRNLFIWISTLLVLLIAFFVVRYLQKNKSNKLLAQKNQVIESALLEKEMLLKEIHHRVKNNLQVISSLLNLQAESLSDASALQAIMDGQNRVKSMSLIHQRLYQGSDLRGVDVQDYLKNLIPQLINSFNLDDKEIDYKIEVGDMKLDVDTLVPLGLIINELVTNSMKHAFEGKDHGIIELIMKETNGQLHVRIKDDGKGMDEAALEQTNSFGWKMIGSLSRKLKAELKVLNDHGTVVDILVGRYKLVV